MITALLISQTLLSAPKAEGELFIRKGMEESFANDGYIQLPVAATKLASVQQKLQQLIAKQPKLTLGSSDSLRIAAALVDSNQGTHYDIKLAATGKGGENTTINKLVITVTDTGWLDDALDGQRYQYTIVLNNKGIPSISSARAWMKPNARRYSSHLKFYKEEKIKWGNK